MSGTFQSLMACLPLAKTYYTDEYSVYRAFSRRHRVIGKGGKVNRNEGHHSLLRDSYTAFVGNAKGLTRSLRMLEASITLAAVAKGFL